MTNQTSAMFEGESTIYEYLSTVNIPGLVVMTSADVNDAIFKALGKPTAIVAMGPETTTTQNNRGAVVAETTIHVYLVLRGATRSRENSDYFFRDSLFQALHGQLLIGMQSELEWRSTTADYQAGARTYLMTFVAKTIKRVQGQSVPVR